MKRKWTYKKETVICPVKLKPFFIAHAKSVKTPNSKIKVTKWRGKVGGVGYKITYNRRKYVR